MPESADPVAPRAGGSSPRKRETAHLGRSEPWQGFTVEAAELVVCDPEASPVLCDAYLYQPEPHEEALGALSLILETINLPAITRRASEDTDETSPARTLLDAVAAVLRDEYYRDPGREMLASFEAALTAANSRLAAAAERGDSDWLSNLHGAIAAFHARTLHVSRVGNSSLFLARRGRLTDIGEGLADPGIQNPRAAFMNIASGTVAEQDTLTLSGPQLFRFLPRERLASFLLGKNPRDVVAYFRDLIAETAEPTSFAAIFLRFVRAPITLPAPTIVVTPRAPLYPAREEVLRPPALSPTLRRPRVIPRPPLRLRQGWFERTLLLTRRALVLLWTLLVTRVVPTLARAGRTGARTAQEAARKTSVSARSLLAARTPAAGGMPTARLAAPPQRMVATARAVPRQLRRAVASWPRSTKAFSVLTLILAILFVGSLLLLRQKREEEAAIRAASEKLQEARVKKDAADAALIYDNLDEARRLLRAARQGALTIEQGPYYDAEAAALLSDIQATEDKTERSTRLAEPARVGDFRSAAPEGRVTGLALVGAHLFAFHPETNAIVRLSIENGETSVVSQTSQGVGYFRAVLPLAAEQMLLFTTDAPGLALFDAAKGDLIKQEVETLPEGTKEIRTLATFGSRLYLLLPGARQIFGYSKTLAGYTGGAPWLKDQNVPAERSVGMGVDGYIYLLTDDGKIVKLLKGSPVDFAQSELTTPLERPTRLVINETLKFLYVLDPPQRRVVVYDTTGKLSRQFVFPNAQDLRDITVGGKDETLYLLDGTAVYKAPLK